jgi:uncharacterized protein YndB with AHSA1/START domain
VQLPPEEEDMINVEHSVVIDRPVKDVFAYVADQTNEPNWHTDVLAVRPEGPSELGSTVTWLINFIGQNQDVSEVTAFDPDRRIQLTARRGPLKPTLYPHIPTGKRPDTIYRGVQIPFQGIFRLLGPVMKVTGAPDRRNARFAQNLKELLER